MTERFVVGDQCVINDKIVGDPEKKLHGAEVTIIECHGLKDYRGHAEGHYRVRLNPGFGHRWSLPVFHLYDHSLEHLPPVDMQQLRSELEHELIELRKEVS